VGEVHGFIASVNGVELSVGVRRDTVGCVTGGGCYGFG
jgi:hypothetical protein